MSKKEKLISRLKTRSKDFTFEEMETLLFSLGFVRSKTGKTGGSRVRYVRNGNPLYLHKPHPSNILKPYQVRNVINVLSKEDLI
jgi:hypothetical protein